VPSAREAERAIEVSARCGCSTGGVPWTIYETVRPVRAIGPSLRHVAAVAQLRRRRHCVRCGKRDDRDAIEPTDCRPRDIAKFAAVV